MLDADIRRFFDNLSHEWTMKFIEHRVADRRILRLIRKWLKAGLSEDGQWSETKLGTPQGAVASPLLADVSALHLDLWADVWGARKSQRAMWLSSAMLTILWSAFSTERKLSVS